MSRWCLEAGWANRPASRWSRPRPRNRTTRTSSSPTPASRSARAASPTPSSAATRPSTPRVAALGRRDEEARSARGAALLLAYETPGRSRAIRTHLTALLETDPKNAQFRQRLARANFLLDRPDDAFSDLKVAFKDDPTLDPPELTMALLWTAKHDFAKADEWYAKAVADHGNSAKVHRGLGGYLLDRGRIETAKSTSPPRRRSSRMPRRRRRSRVCSRDTRRTTPPPRLSSRSW